MPAPLLLHFAISHYNEKVRWALDYKRWPHRREALTPGLHIPRARWLSGQNKLPVLVLNARVLIGSNHILEAMEQQRPAYAWALDIYARHRGASAELAQG